MLVNYQINRDLNIFIIKKTKSDGNTVLRLIFSFEKPLKLVAGLGFEPRTFRL